MLKEYAASEPIKEGEGEEEITDYFNTNLVVMGYPDEEGNQTKQLWQFPLFNMGFVNKDLVDLPDDQVSNIMISPEESFIGNQESSFGLPDQFNKTAVIRYLKNLSPEQQARTPLFSSKDTFTLERNGIEIMQNVVRRVTEVQVLDAERIPLMNAVGEAIVDALTKISSYPGGNPAPPMNVTLDPSSDIQAVSDAISAFSEKDEEMRTLLDELAKEVKIFINNTEE